MRKASLLTVALFTLMAHGARADEGRVPIFGPTTITAPGSYFVTRNISVTSGDVIVIQASNVTLDLNGKSVTSQATTGFLVRLMEGSTDVTVQNGRLSGGAYGVIYTTANPTTAPRTRVRIENVEVRSTNAQGIAIVPAEYAEIISCRLVNPGLEGIVLNGVNADVGGRIVGTRVEGARRRGMLLERLANAEIRGNEVTRFGLEGLVGSVGLLWGGNTGTEGGGNLVVNNTVRGGGAPGLTFGSTFHDLVLNNVVSDNGDMGINVGVGAAGCLVAGNVTGGNSTDGIRVWSANNLIDGNQSEGNTGCGIRFESGALNSAYRNNMLVGNLGGTVCGTGRDAGGNIR